MIQPQPDPSGTADERFLPKDRLQALMDALLDANVGLARYFTYVVTKPVKAEGLPPLDLLTG